MIEICDKGVRLCRKEMKMGNSQIEKDVLNLIAYSVMADRKAIGLIHWNQSYISKTIKKLSDKKFIKEVSSKKLYRLLNSGTDSLEKEIQNYYNNFSYNGRPGMTEAHLESFQRLSQVNALMIRAGILCGAEKQFLEEQEIKEKYEEDVSIFIAEKEIRFSQAQQKTRGTLTRAVGIIYSRGICGPVYNAMTINILLKKKEELQAILRTRSIESTIFKTKRTDQTVECLVFIDDDETAIEILSNQDDKKTKSLMNIACAASSKKNLGVPFRYVPLTEDGIITLKLITMYKRQEIAEMCFSEEERKTEKTIQACDAMVKQIPCFEFLSANITKMHFAKQLQKEGYEIGVVCWEGQIDFLNGFFKDNIPKMRCIKKEFIKKAIGETEDP